MTEKIVVVFRKFKKGGDLIALFPTVINYPNGNCESYMHVGQHSAAGYTGVMCYTVAATPEEYAPLKQELESIGYVLDIKKRFREPKSV